MDDKAKINTINNSNYKVALFDKPITYPDEDRLGYEDFSKRFARIIGHGNSSDGYVIALTGDWGCGKTSVLNFTEYFLTNKWNEIGLSEIEVPVVLHFNPWIFSGREDLIKQFFNQIHEEFGSDITRSKLASAWDQILPFIDDLVKYGLSVSDYLPENKKIPVKMSLHSLSFLKNQIPNRFKKADKKQLSLFEEREKLSKGFEEKLSRKIIIIIDDIDRLTNEEILTFFRAIKAIMDFPNVIFILAYDETVVRDAINRKMCVNNSNIAEKNCAKKYLEKIVQLSIPFPPPNEVLKEKYIEDKLSEIFQKTPEDYISNEHWFYVKDSISHFLSTPRRIKRTINTIKILYPSVENEVNVNDFICLETIRQCLLNVYNKIKENPEYFLYPAKDNSVMRGVGKAEHKRFHTEWYNSIDDNDKKPALTIIENLFPDIQGAIDFHDIILIYHESGKIRAARISANKEIFDRYFRMEIENYDYSIHEIRQLLTKPFTPNVFSKMLLSYLSEKDEILKISKAGIFLKQLQNYVDESSDRILSDQVESIMLSFFYMGDELLIQTDQHPGFIGTYGNSTVIKLLSQKLLMITDRQKRIKILEDGFNRGRSLSFIALILYIMNEDVEKWKATVLEFDPMSDDDKLSLDRTVLIDEENLSKLKTIFDKNLRKVTLIDSSPSNFDYEIFKKPLIGIILEMWKKSFGDSEKIKKYVINFINNEDVWILSIIASSLHEKGLSIHTLQDYISKDDQKLRILNILTKRNDLPQNERDILTKFIDYKTDL